MVNKDLVNWLAEAAKRGYTFQLLKKKLLESGFPETDINEAIAQIQGRPSPKKYPLPAPGKVDLFAPAGAQQPAMQPGQQPPQSKPKLEEVKPMGISPLAKPGEAKSLKSQEGIKTGALGEGGKWMKIAGVMGIILLLITLSSVVMNFVAKDMLFSSMMNQTVSLILFVIILIITFFYYFGFVKLGKRANEKLLSLGSWFIIVPIILYVVLFIVAGLIVQPKFAEYMIGGGGESFKVSFLIIAIVWVVLFLINAMGQLLFSIGLIKTGKQVKFSKIAGILNIVVFVAILTFVVSLVVLVYTLLNALSGDVDLIGLIDSLGASSQFAIYSFMAFYALRIVAFVFETMTLFKASKMFES